MKSATGGDKKLLIRDVVVKKGGVHLTTLAGKTVAATSPDIRLKDVGKNGGGTSPADAFREMFRALCAKITSPTATEGLTREFKDLGVWPDVLGRKPRRSSRRPARRPPGPTRTTRKSNCTRKGREKAMETGTRRTYLGRVALVLLVALLVGAGALRSAAADDAQDAQQLVEKARLTMNAFVADKDMGPPLKGLLKKAQGVVIYPQVLRGAFIVGASGGNGVCLAYDEKAKRWNGPAFYTIGEASFGLQIGGDASEVVLVALTERGVSSLLATSAKLGGNASVAAGPVGVGAEAATQNLSADIVAYSRAKGAYAGVSLEGAVVATRDALNQAYYNKKEVSPTDILVKHTVTNKNAAPLVQAVAKAAGKGR